MAPLSIARGRRFECTRCGNCCQKDGIVLTSEAEIARMAKALGKTSGEFWRDYRVQTDADSGRPFFEAADGKGCPLLTKDRLCSVHAVKPAQCSAWPFWSEMIADRAEWEAAKSFCPGLDAPKGRKYKRLEIIQISEQEARTGADE
ncbi:MAG: YkgJ family cysteine cluster protein [Myxococcota bacterium]